MAHRVLVVDDDREIVRLLRAYLERSGYQVLVANDGKSALQLIQSERPDLVLLDLMLPGYDGWELTRRMRKDSNLSATPIVMITARVEEEDRIVGLELGADDYVTKPFNPLEVVARVRAVLRRTHGEPVAPQVIEAGPLRLDLPRHEAKINGAVLGLTPTEFDILRALAEYPGHVLSRDDLIEKALGYSYEGLDRTVDSHVKNLRRKIDKAAGEGKGTEMISTVFGVGYRFEATEKGDA